MSNSAAGLSESPFNREHTPVLLRDGNSAESFRCGALALKSNARENKTGLPHAAMLMRGRGKGAEIRCTISMQLLFRSPSHVAVLDGENRNNPSFEGY